MRLTAFLLFTLLLHVCKPGLSQQVSISGNNMSLEQVFAAIKKQTDLEFFYESAALKNTRRVTINVQNKPVDEVLTICLQGQGLGYNIRANTIIIFTLENNEKSQLSPPQTDSTIVITGRVVDVTGQPVEMASVVLARTRSGTQTDRSGKFNLKIPKLLEHDSLHISFVGFKTTAIKPRPGQVAGDIVLQVADHALDQAVIIAYGTTTEKFRTGDITTVKAADIERTPTLNVVEALAGRVPGMYVRQKGGNPGSVYDINLRGASMLPPSAGMSLSTDATEVLSKPLIVLDGLPLPPEVINETGQNPGVEAVTGVSGAAGGQDVLYWLNPLDVESLTVLKDAEATALYGSRAANGVIVITTKKGKPGKGTINISLNTGINTNARPLKLMNTQQYLAMRHEAWRNTMRAGLRVFGGNGYTSMPEPGNSYDLLFWDTTRYTNWQKVLLGSAPVYNANISLTGGEGSTTYRLSAGHNRFKSSYPHLQGKPAFRDTKSTLSLSLSTHSFNNRLKLTASVAGSSTDSYQPHVNPDEYIFLAPNAPSVFDDEGNLNFTDWRRPGIFRTTVFENPLWILAAGYQSNRFSMLSRTTLSYEIVRSLVFTIGMGYSRADGKQWASLPSVAFDPTLPSFPRQSVFGYSNSYAFNIEPNLRYETRAGRHAISVLAGTSYQSDKQEGRILLATGYTSDELMRTPDGAPSITSGTQHFERKSVSALARISYRYADEFLLDLSGRRDGSSSFGPGRRYGNFGSIGAGWIFTREAWSKKMPLVSFGKIRGSYGITGSQSINPYGYLSTFRSSNATASTSGVYQGIYTFSLTRIANPKLAWAQAATSEIGLDLYLFKSQQLKLTIQWYRRITGDQLVNRPVSAVTGTTEYFANLPVKLENKGLEVMIDYSSLRSSAGWQWFVQLNVAANKNNLRHFPRLEHSTFSRFYSIGLPLAWQQLYRTSIDSATHNYEPESGTDPYKVSKYPSLTGGIQTGFSYKRLSLSLSFVFAKQKGFTNVQGTVYPGELDAMSNSNQPASILRGSRWQSPADDGMGGAFHAATVSYNDRLDINWGDASYVAIKNASLNYDLPQALLKKAGLSHLGVYARAENLLFLSISDYKGMNPEQPGLDKQLPLRMVFVSGFSITL